MFCVNCRQFSLEIFPKETHQKKVEKRANKCINSNFECFRNGLLTFHKVVNLIYSDIFCHLLCWTNQWYVFFLLPHTVLLIVFHQHFNKTWTFRLNNFHARRGAQNKSSVDRGQIFQFYCNILSIVSLSFAFWFWFERFSQFQCMFIISAYILTLLNFLGSSTKNTKVLICNVKSLGWTQFSVRKNENKWIFIGWTFCWITFTKNQVLAGLKSIENQSGCSTVSLPNSVWQSEMFNYEM